MAFGDHLWKRIKNKWNGDDVPDAPTNLYSGPGAVWGWDPNAPRPGAGTTTGTTSGTSGATFTAPTFTPTNDAYVAPTGPWTSEQAATNAAARVQSSVPTRGATAYDFQAPDWWQSAGGTSSRPPAGVTFYNLRGAKSPSPDDPVYGKDGEPILNASGTQITRSEYEAAQRDYQNSIDRNAAQQDPRFLEHQGSIPRAGDEPQPGGVQLPPGVSPVAMGNVYGSQPGMAAAQLALQQMTQRSQEGWSALDRLALDQANKQASQYEQGQRDAGRQSMAARGMTGSGMDAMYGMMAQQAGADRSADMATTLGIAGRDRAAANTTGMANLGLGMDTQAFQQAQARAMAVDAYNMWATSKQDDAALQQYNAAMDRYAQIQADRQVVTNGATQAAGSIYGMG